MTARNEDLETLPQLFYEAVQQVMHANIAPMLALWSEQDDVTYCDPYGHHHQGRDGIVVSTVSRFVEQTWTRSFASPFSLRLS